MSRNHNELTDLHEACHLALELSAYAKAFPADRQAHLRALALQADGIRLMALRAVSEPQVQRVLEGL